MSDHEPAVKNSKYLNMFLKLYRALINIIYMQDNDYVMN